MKFRSTYSFFIVFVSIVFIWGTAIAENGVGGIEDFNPDQKGRIGNLEATVVDLQWQIDNMSVPQKSGFVTVPLMPAWELRFSTSTAKRVYCYWEGPPVKWHNMNGAYCDTSVNWSGWMSAGIDISTYTRFFTPIQLPDGATITSLGIWAYDNDPTYDGRVILRRSPVAWGAEATTVPSVLYTSGYANVPRMFTVDYINPSRALVDNSQENFYLDARVEGGTDVVFISAVVGYEFQ